MALVLAPDRAVPRPGSPGQHSAERRPVRPGPVCDPRAPCPRTDGCPLGGSPDWWCPFPWVSFHARLPASSEGPALLGRQGPLPPGADAELVVPPGSGGRLPGWETGNEDAVDGRGSGRGRLSQRQAGSSKEVNRRRAGPARSRFRAAACQTAGAEPPLEWAAAGQAQTLGRWWPWTRSSHVTAVWVRSSSFRRKWRPCPES